MIEILQVVSTLDTGGVETLLLNYYKHIDRSKFHWTFVFPADEIRNIGMCEMPLKELGADIYTLPRRQPNFFKHLLSYYFFIMKSKHRFDIVHSHLDEMNTFYLGIAMILGIKKRISHCHVAFTKRGFFREFVCFLAKPLLQLTCTHKFACSYSAANFLYGNDKHVFIMKNAIDINHFKYNHIIRDNIRNKYNIDEKDVVIGCVARFFYQKNHQRLINIFSEYFKLNPYSYLVLVGNGPLEHDIRQQIDNLKLGERVIFTGLTKKVGEFLNSFDCFVLPSRFEGLGIVYIESQVNNLHTFATKERVPVEVKISPYMHFISENENDINWAKQINETITQFKNNRKETTYFAENAGYEISSAAGVLEKKYCSIIKNNYI